MVLGGEQLRMISVEGELPLVVLSSPRPKKPSTVEWLWVPFCQVQLVRHLNCAASGARRPPPRFQQCCHVDAVVDGGSGHGHRSCSPFLQAARKRRLPPATGQRKVTRPAKPVREIRSSWLSRHRRAGITGRLGEPAEHEPVAVTPPQLVVGDCESQVGSGAAACRGRSALPGGRAGRRGSDGFHGRRRDDEHPNGRCRAPPDRRRRRLSRLAAARLMMTWAPAGIVAPPSATGSTAYRNVEWGTGAPNRSNSSNAVASLPGSPRSNAS